MFEKRLKVFITLAYKQQSEFAKAINAQKSQVSQWVHGVQYPSFDRLIEIYNSGCSLDWLLTGKGSLFSLSEKGEQLKNEYESLNTPIDSKTGANTAQILIGVQDALNQIENTTKQLSDTRSLLKQLIDNNEL